MTDTCPNCGFHVPLSPRERRSHEREVESLTTEVSKLRDIQIAYIKLLSNPEELRQFIQTQVDIEQAGSNDEGTP